MLADRLKTTTQAAHAAAEASPSMRALMAPEVTLDAYRDHLCGVLRFLAPAEARLTQVPGLANVVPRVRERLRKMLWLTRDLNALGAAAPLGGDVPGAALDVPAALGMLYVIEGSTLGGRIIERHLVRTLGLTPQTGVAYYHGYGAHRGPMWSSFRSALDAYGTTHPDRVDAVVRSADRTFVAFGEALAGEAISV